MIDRTRARRGHSEPLWDRIEANRTKVGAFIALFVGGAALSAALLVGVGGLIVGILLLGGFRSGTDFFSALPWVTFGALVLGAVLAVLHIGRMLTRPEDRLPGLFGAAPSQPGSLPATESALHDMALAAGCRPPHLWLIDDCDRINAFALGMDETRAAFGITRGFVDRLPAEDQRAVFANLMARMRAGDTMWATVLSAIMGPIWSQRATQLNRDARLEVPPKWDNALTATGSGGAATHVYPQGVLGGFILGFFGVVLTEMLMAGHERAALAAAEKADAEGMLLLKDPEQMLQALEDVLVANNTVPGAGEAYSALFFCWAGAGYAPDEDPEMERLGRLREVLGAAGA